MDAIEQKKIDDILCIFSPQKSIRPQVSYNFTYGNYTVQAWGPVELYMQKKVFQDFTDVVKHLEEYANKLHKTFGFDPATPTIVERDHLAGRFMQWHLHQRRSENKSPVVFAGDDRMPRTLPNLTNMELFWDVLKYFYMIENHKSGAIAYRAGHHWCSFKGDRWADIKTQVEEFLNEHGLITDAQEVAKMV